MTHKPQRTREQQEYRDKLAQTLKNLKELGNEDLARILLERQKDTAEYIDANKRTIGQSENKEKLGDFSLEHQIENFLMSKEFENYFFKLNFKGKQCAIGAVLMYSIAFQDETKPIDYKDCMELIKCFVKNGRFIAKKKLIELISKKLGVKEGDYDYEKKMKEYIYDKIYKNGYVFHAFNSACEKSIKKNGISASIRLTPENEIRELGSLMSKYREPFDIFYTSGKDSERVCYDHRPDNAWDYANRSPERFGLLVHTFKRYYYWDKDLPDRSVPFEYENIVKGMERFFKERNVTEKDKTKIKELFDKNFKIYGNGKPTLAMIKLQSIDNYFDTYADYDCKGLLLFLFDGENRSVNKDIPIEDIKIVHFPENLSL